MRKLRPRRQRTMRDTRPWLLPRHHNDEISFLFLFAFPFLLFFHAKIGFAKLSASTPPTVQCRSRSPSRQPAAGSRCKIKVQNVRSDAERVVDGENERPALRAFGCARWPCCRQQEQEQRVSAVEVELQQQSHGRTPQGCGNARCARITSGSKRFKACTIFCMWPLRK